MPSEDLRLSASKKPIKELPEQEKPMVSDTVQKDDSFVVAAVDEAVEVCLPEAL